MKKIMDEVYRYYAWIILALSIAAYFVFYTLNFNGSLEQAINDWRSWLHLVFVTWLNITMAGTAFDSGMQWGLTSDEYELADKVNDNLIKAVKNEKSTFRGYVKELNESELEALRDDFLFSLGKDYDDLTPKELKRYNKLIAIQHDIHGFDLPLYYEISRNGKIKYNASINVGKKKLWIRLQRAFGGVLFGAMTVNISFAWSNIGDAFASVLVIISGLAITFILIAFPQYFRLKFILPKRVIMKQNLWDTYKERKTAE